MTPVTDYTVQYSEPAADGVWLPVFKYYATVQRAQEQVWVMRSVGNLSHCQFRIVQRTQTFEQIECPL